MKTRIITLILILVSLYSFAQDQSEYDKLFWNSNGKYDKTTEIPEKWKGESAVIIYKNENYKFHKFGKYVTYTMSFRKRIKLLDKNAVKEYSEFSYDEDFGMATVRRSYWKKERVIGVKIIKPNGKEIIIDLDNTSVKENSKTKIAIPNLEVGDILDYYLFLEDKIFSVYQFGFDPEEHTIASEYPIMDYKLTLTTENDFFINFNSFNGAPELKKVASEKKRVRKYKFVATDIEKITGKRWNYPMVSNPCYKFQVYFARSGKFENYAEAFLPEKENIIKKKVSKSEVLNFYNRKYRTVSTGFIIKNYIKSKKYKNDVEKITDVYYYMRHFYLNRYLEATYINKTQILNYAFQYYNNAKYMDTRKEFIREFTSFLKQNKISYKIIVSKSRYDGPIEELLLELNAKVLIKTETKPPLYISMYDSHKAVNQMLPSIEGTKAYAIELSSFKKNEQVQTITLPTRDYKQNNNTQTAIVKINDDFSAIAYDITNSYTGNLKTQGQHEHMYFGDFVYAEYEKYGTKPFLNHLRSKKKRAMVKRKFDDLKTKIEKSLKEKLQKSTSDGFGFTEELEDYTHKIVKKGRYDFEQPFIIQETFSVKSNFIKRAGKNYIVEIGKFINQQIDIKEEERKRNQDIYMSFPRSYENIIKFEIPEGYAVSGIEKLNKKIDNETGSFISTAKIEGNQLIINTSKNYKHNYETNVNWPKMLEFLDEAFQFTNEKYITKEEVNFYTLKKAYLILDKSFLCFFQNLLHNSRCNIFCLTKRINSAFLKVF